MSDGPQDRAGRVAAAFVRLVPLAIAEVQAADTASRGALASRWRDAARGAPSLSRHVHGGEPLTDAGVAAHARVVALQSFRCFGVKVYGLLFCSAHHRAGLPTNGLIFMCPDCYDGPEYWDDDGADLDLMSIIGIQSVKDLEFPEGSDLL